MTVMNDYLDPRRYTPTSNEPSRFTPGAVSSYWGLNRVERKGTRNGAVQAETRSTTGFDLTFRSILQRFFNASFAGCHAKRFYMSPGKGANPNEAPRFDQATAI